MKWTLYLILFISMSCVKSAPSETKIYAFGFIEGSPDSVYFEVIFSKDSLYVADGISMELFEFTGLGGDTLNVKYEELSRSDFEKYFKAYMPRKLFPTMEVDQLINIVEYDSFPANSEQFWKDYLSRYLELTQGKYKYVNGRLSFDPEYIREYIKEP